MPQSAEQSYIGAMQASVEKVEAAPAASDSLASNAAQRVEHLARRALQVMPRTVRDQVVRQRHLEHVTANTFAVTDPTLMAIPPVDNLQWISRNKHRPPESATAHRCLSISRA